MKKSLVYYLLLVLLALFIISINNTSFAMTSADIEEFTQEMVEWQTRFNSRPQGNGYAQNVFFNSNYWVSEKANVPFEDYDSALIRITTQSSPTRAQISIFLYNYSEWNINFSCTGRIAEDSAINGSSTKVLPISTMSDIYYVLYTATTQGMSQTTDFTKSVNTSQTISSNSNITNSNTLFMIKNNIVNRTNFKILGYNIYNKIKCSGRVVTGITKMADIYIGEYYATGTITYRLYYTRLGDRVYLDWNYNAVYENEFQYNQARGELYALNIFDEIETSTAYIEAVYNNDYVIATSNIFNLQVIIPSEPTINGHSVQYNQSGEPVGYIDLSNITSAIVSGDQKIINQLQENQNAMESGNTKILEQLQENQNAMESGNTKILEQLKENESGEQARFNIFQAMFNGLFTLSEEDIQQLSGDLHELLDDKLGAEVGGSIYIFERFQDLEPSDFKIEWDDIYYSGTVLIPSGDINFSKMTRDNSTLRQVMGYVRIFVGGALAIVCLRALWKFIAISTGIGMEMYDEAEQEKEIIEQHHDTINYDTGEVTSRVVYKRGNHTLTTKGKVKGHKRL